MNVRSNPIYLSSLSLKRTLSTGKMDLFAFVDCAYNFGFSGIEISDRQIMDIDLQLLSRRIKQFSLDVILDVGCDLTYRDMGMQEQEIRYVEEMMCNAKLLGAHIMRITLGGQSFSIQNLFHGKRVSNGKNNTISSILSLPSLAIIQRNVRRSLPVLIVDRKNKMQRAIDVLNRLKIKAKKLDVVLAIENHWGISSRPEWMIEIIDRVDSGFVRTCVDFGNFPASIDPYKGIEVLLKKAGHVQAKSYRFDENGYETTIDYLRCLKLVNDSDYDGAIAVEYEGKNELAGSIATMELILSIFDGSE